MMNHCASILLKKCSKEYRATERKKIIPLINRKKNDKQKKGRHLRSMCLFIAISDLAYHNNAAIDRSGVLGAKRNRN